MTGAGPTAKQSDLTPKQAAEGAHIGPATPDGLFLYTEAERTKAAVWLQNAVADTIIDKIHSKSGAFSGIVNVVLGFMDDPRSIQEKDLALPRLIHHQDCSTIQSRQDDCSNTDGNSTPSEMRELRTTTRNSCIKRRWDLRTIQQSPLTLILHTRLRSSQSTYSTLARNTTKRPAAAFPTSVFSSMK